MNLEFNDFAKDIKLNVSSIFNHQDQDGLTNKQIQLIALASAYATKNSSIISAIADYSVDLNEQEINAAKTAATLMAMNNVYYRTVHFASSDYAKIPARLRMNGLANHGIEKSDFELMALAVSAINGCQFCVDAHVRVLEKIGLEKTAIHTSFRIAATISGAAQALMI